MKVFINKLPRDYSAGMIIVAASNKEEADRVYYDWLVKNRDYHVCYWNALPMSYDVFCINRDDRSLYPKDGWTELVGVTADLFLAAQVLAEESYIE